MKKQIFFIIALMLCLLTSDVLAMEKKGAVQKIQTLTCFVCQENIELREQISSCCILNCKHMYHKQCFKEIKDNTCPCGKSIEVIINKPNRNLMLKLINNEPIVLNPELDTFVDDRILHELKNQKIALTSNIILQLLLSYGIKKSVQNNAPKCALGCAFFYFIIHQFLIPSCYSVNDRKNDPIMRLCPFGRMIMACCITSFILFFSHAL